MNSFWPSFSLLAFYLAIFLQCRLIAGRATIPLGGFAAYFVYGCSGATVLSLLLQQIPFLQVHDVANASGVLVPPAAWWAAPPIEEFAKALPVIVLVFATQSWRRLSIADLTLIGFASGAGFGFVESNLAALAGTSPLGAGHLLLFGYRSAESATSAYAVYFAGHAVYPALFALAAGAGLRLYPIDRLYAWIPSAVVFAVACFDHALFNWKVLHTTAAGSFESAGLFMEALHWLTLHGSAAVWLLPAGLLAAQAVEGHMCAKILGRRAEMVLPGERRGWVVYEWLVVAQRLPLGCSVFDHTLDYFRRRRAFAIAALEAHRNPAIRPLAQYAKLLEERAIQEQAELVSPPPGDWLTPRATWQRNLADLAWRVRFVLAFAVLFVPFFMVDLSVLPRWLRGALFGDVTAKAVAAAGLAFACWRIYAFYVAPRPDPVASDGAAMAGRHARVLLLTAAFASGIVPVLTVFLGWTPLAANAAYFSGYFAAWVGGGGNLYSALGLSAFGSALETDPERAGGALRDEIEAGWSHIRRLERQYQKKISQSLPGQGREAANFDVVELSALIAEIDAERETQGRRVRTLEICERGAREAQTSNLGHAVTASIEEFERLRREFDAVLEAEQRKIEALEQGFDRYLGAIGREIGSYGAANEEIREALDDFWRPRKDLGWALRVARVTDEEAVSLLKLFIPDLETLKPKAGADREILEDAIARLKAREVAFVKEESPAPSSEPPWRVRTGDTEEAAELLPETQEPEIPEEADGESPAPVSASEESGGRVPDESFERGEEQALTLETPPPEELADEREADTEPPLESVEPETPIAPVTEEVLPAPFALAEEQALIFETPPPEEVADEREADTEPALESVELEAPVVSGAEEMLPASEDSEELLLDASLELADEKAPDVQTPPSYQPPAQSELDLAKDILDAELAAALRGDARTAESELPLGVNAPGWSPEEAEHATPSPGIPTVEDDAAPHAPAASFAVRTDAEEWHGNLKDFADLAQGPEGKSAPQFADFADPFEPGLSRREDKTKISSFQSAPSELRAGAPPPAEPDLSPAEDKRRVAAYQPASTERKAPAALPAEPGLPPAEDKRRVAAYQPAPTERKAPATSPAEPGLPPVEDKRPVVAYQPAPTDQPAPTERKAPTPVPAPPPAPDRPKAQVKQPAAASAPLPPSTEEPDKKPVPKEHKEPTPAVAGKSAAAPQETAKQKPAARPEEAIRAIETSPIKVDVPPAPPAGLGEVDEEDPDLSLDSLADIDIAGGLIPRLPDSAKEKGFVARLLGRGLGRGKFARPAPPKLEPAPQLAQPASTVSFRAAKYYSGTNSASAGTGIYDRTPSPVKAVTGKTRALASRPAKAAAKNSFRPDKFYKGANEAGTGQGEGLSDASPPQKNSFRPVKFYRGANAAGREDGDHTESAANASDSAVVKSPLADALSEYFERTGETPPPMHTLDGEELKEVLESGRLETERRGVQPWSFSGIPRRGDFAIRLRRGSDRHVEFIPSNVTFGQTPRYYARRVGVGTAHSYIPAEHLEYFDARARGWLPMKQ